MPEAEPATAVFDIIGTCFSLEKPRRALTRLGAPEHALELGFAQALRDSFGSWWRPARIARRRVAP